MQKSLFALVTVCLVGSLTIDEAWARGPRGGAGPRGGMRPSTGPTMHGPTGPGLQPTISAPSHLSGPGNLGTNTGLKSPDAGRVTPQSVQQFLQGQQPRAQQARTTAGQWANQWTSSHPEPFTPAWYAEHPKAWQYTHPHADAAVVATTAGIAAWLTAPLAVAAVSSSSSYGTVAVSEVPAEQEVSEPALDSPSTADLNENVEWRTIGVFQLKRSIDGPADRAIQLAVSQDGTVRGTHFDLLTNDVEDIHGSINKQNLQVAWKIGLSGKVVFQAPLDELTKNEGRVAVHQPNGTVETWITQRVNQ